MLKGSVLYNEKQGGSARWRLLSSGIRPWRSTLVFLWTCSFCFKNIFPFPLVPSYAFCIYAQYKHCDLYRIFYQFFSFDVSWTEYLWRCFVYIQLSSFRPLTSLTISIIRLAVTLFPRIFTGEGTKGYVGCDSSEQRGLRLENQPW
jgi:hypothetical protein